MDLPYVKKYVKFKDVDVYLVDGDYIRNHISVDFTLGGHDIVYDYIPKNEIWIEHTTDPKEIPALLVHERFERDLMLEGLEYEKAHSLASIIELYCRQNPCQIKDILNII